MRVPRLLSAAIVAGTLGLGVTPAHADIFVTPFLGVKFRGSTNQLDGLVSSNARLRFPKFELGSQSELPIPNLPSNHACSGPVLLAEVNFQAMYEAQQAQAAGRPNGSGIITSAN